MSLNHLLPSISQNSSATPPAGHSPTRALNQLVPCVYVALRCPHCGESRQALAVLPPSGDVPCPECGIACSFVLLGSGLTTWQLPFHEIRSGEQLRWITQEADKIDCS